MRAAADLLTLGWGPTGHQRRLYRRGDEDRFTPRGDFAAQWAAAPGLPEGPKWTLCRGVGRGLTPEVVGVGGLEPARDGAPDEHLLWGFSAALDARGWSAVRLFARETVLFAEQALGARRIWAAAPAERPEASALLARLDFAPELETELAGGGRARLMMRRRD